MKRCTKCGDSFPATTDYFHKKVAAKDGLTPHCKTCGTIASKSRMKHLRDTDPAFNSRQQAGSREWHSILENKDRVRHNYRRRTYGKTPEEFAAQLAAQNNACAICKQTFTETPHNDHNHTDGTNRGLLCSACNLMLGKAKDSPVILHAAIEYLIGWAS